MRDLLKRGIAVHHSGILPIIKEVGQHVVCITVCTLYMYISVLSPFVVSQQNAHFEVHFAPSVIHAFV